MCKDCDGIYDHQVPYLPEFPLLGTILLDKILISWEMFFF